MTRIINFSGDHAPSLEKKVLVILITWVFAEVRKEETTKKTTKQNTVIPFKISTFLIPGSFPGTSIY
jgi:hypothetical protein